MLLINVSSHWQHVRCVSIAYMIRTYVCHHRNIQQHPVVSPSISYVTEDGDWVPSAKRINGQPYQLVVDIPASLWPMGHISGPGREILIRLRIPVCLSVCAPGPRPLPINKACSRREGVHSEPREMIPMDECLRK